ncbi:MAG TPA: transposase [Methanocella sp.]|nr:transposase [Methanocella sp.]
MRKTYRFRLYPTKAQETAMEHGLELCRIVYNKTLEARKTAYEERGETLSKYALNNLLPSWKQETPELRKVFSQTLQEVQERVDLAFKHFFRRVKNGEVPGYPRFKGKGWYDSFTYPQMGFKLDGNKLYLSKVGDVRIKLHRPFTGNVKRVTITRSCDKWYASLTVESDNIQTISKSVNPVIGIDMGLAGFATLSNGIKIANPGFFRKEEKELARVQRKLSKIEKGEPERRKTVKIVRKVHERISNKRHDFAHQLSRKLVSEYGFISFEDLDIRGMARDSCLAKSIGDAAWRLLITATRYKAVSAGTTVVLVNPACTSQLCSRCGQTVKKELKDRAHECPCCGLVMDRDENAAVNILRLGLQSVAKA